MIEVKVKIHDKFSFEFKISFIVNQQTKTEDLNEFSINTWLFVPNNIDINSSTYSKEQFYKDTKSNVRLITPVFSLEEIYGTEKGSPINNLKSSVFLLAEDSSSISNIDNYTYHLKMFACICKSAMRDQAYFIRDSVDAEIPSLCKEYIFNIESIIAEYRSLWSTIESDKISQEQKELYYFCDEFIGNIVEQQIFRLMRGIDKEPSFNIVKEGLCETLNKEITYKKKRGYSVLDKENTTNNYLVIMRRGILKKFIESDLYLNTKKSKDGAFAEQISYGIAAGTAMIFATVVAFTAQIRYGTLTTPLFLALVVSYIFKDRIKDLMRYYLGSQLGKKYYNTKRELEIRKQNIGVAKEAFDFVSEDKTPIEILNIRKRSPLVEAENKIYNEKIILYRKLVSLSSDEFKDDENYKFIGINDITRFNIINFVQKMDNPFVSLHLPDEEKGYISFDGEKVYALHFVIRCESKNNLYFKKFRLLLNKDGIKEIRELKD